MTLFCGIDWAESHHDVAIIYHGGQLVAKKRITDDLSGFAELIEMLTAAGDCAEDPVPVAIETRAACSLRRCGRRGGRCIRSTRWQWPVTASAIGWHGQSPITPTR